MPGTDASPIPYAISDVAWKFSPYNSNNRDVINTKIITEQNRRNVTELTCMSREFSPKITASSDATFANADTTDPGHVYLH